MNDPAPAVICCGEILRDFRPAGPFPGGAPFNVACHLGRLGKFVATQPGAIPVHPAELCPHASNPV